MKLRTVYTRHTFTSSTYIPTYVCVVVIFCTRHAAANHWTRIPVTFTHCTPIVIQFVTKVGTVQVTVQFWTSGFLWYTPANRTPIPSQYLVCILQDIHNRMQDIAQCQHSHIHGMYVLQSPHSCSILGMAGNEPSGIGSCNIRTFCTRCRLVCNQIQCSPSHSSVLDIWVPLVHIYKQGTHPSQYLVCILLGIHNPNEDIAHCQHSCIHGKYDHR